MPIDGTFVPLDGTDIKCKVKSKLYPFEENTKMISTGFILRQYREFYRIKQWELAAQLGFSSSVLCDIEKGRRPLTIDIREKAEELFREQQTHCDSMPEIISSEPRNAR